MSTGLVENWANVDSMGAIYPFTGSEGFLVVLGLAFWIIWHIWQIRSENDCGPCHRVAAVREIVGAYQHLVDRFTDLAGAAGAYSAQQAKSAVRLFMVRELAGFAAK